MKVKQLRFDAWCLRAVVSELQKLVGMECQNAESLGAVGVALQFWDGSSHWVHIRTHSDRYGMRLGEGPERGERTPWVQTLRRELNRATLVAVKQVGAERVANLVFDRDGIRLTLTAELMGKNSNVILRDDHDRSVAAARWSGKAKSERVLLPGRQFVSYPSSPLLCVTEAKPGDDLRLYAGVSPFVQRLLQEFEFSAVQERLRQVGSGATYIPGYGVTPIPLSPADIKELFGVQTVPKYFDSISQALAASEVTTKEPEVEVARTRLRVQLQRIEHARKSAVTGLTAAKELAGKAGELQELGQLVLAYQGQIKLGDTSVRVFDMAGEERDIPLDPEATAVENANALFEQAKRAKGSEAEVTEQLERLSSELTTVQSLIHLTSIAATERELTDVKKEAEIRNWLQIQIAPQTKPKDRPFEGHAIKELLGPNGYAVFYGENSDANDYLTMRMGKPNDWWLHVRGAPSAHVLVRANNQPDRVPHETLRWAATIAAKHSPSKHSQMVPVDYTLKKYVRRPKGSKPGFVNYTHEKTIHVNPTGKS